MCWGEDYWFTVVLKYKCGTSGGGTSSSVEDADQQNRGFRVKDIKEEESEDEDRLCTATVCG